LVLKALTLNGEEPSQIHRLLPPYSLAKSSELNSARSWTPWKWLARLLRSGFNMNFSCGVHFVLDNPLCRAHYWIPSNR
jgi:hypothetical protein